MPSATSLSMSMPRSGALALQRATAACLLAVLAQAAFAFGFDDVGAIAKARAERAFEPARDELPADLKALSYDQYREIEFRRSEALWAREGLPFQVQFFHPGGLHPQTVLINQIDGTRVLPVPFDPAAYDHRKLGPAPAAWRGAGHAGFKVLTALNRPGQFDELVVFLNASYFRALGRGQGYGLSARGLAIDTLGPGPEEFPRYTEFWLERPASDAKQLTIYALMESPRATGAYRFVLRPGEQTAVDVQARLFLRGAIGTLGIAPLTSMFHHAENDPRVGEFRPEVHDSDGLMLQLGDEWLWRPLINPKRPQVSSFETHALKGFGLMQRDRSFRSYEDTEAHYEKRPSTWITPQGDWGAGRVELVQLPTADETSDNIVAYWVPERLPAPGVPLELSYRIAWQGDAQQRPPNGRTLQSRLGRGLTLLPPGQQQYIVDFAGPALEALTPDAAVAPVVSSDSNARIVNATVFQNPAIGGWRLALRYQRLDPARPVELRAHLEIGGNALTETWTTLIPSD